MNIFKALFVVALVAIATVGCKKKTDYNAVAQAMCDCSSEMIALQKQSMSADSATLVQIMADMEAAGTKMETCMGELEAKHPDIEGNAEAEAAVTAAVKTACPDLAELMGN